MLIEEPTKRAEDAGNEWAAQFKVQDDLRGMIASAYAAGWITVYRAGIDDAARIVGGAA